MTGRKTTDWTSSNDNLTAEIISAGEENGNPYIDIRVRGTCPEDRKDDAVKAAVWGIVARPSRDGG